MEDFGREVTPQESPSWAIRGSVDIMLITSCDFGSRKSWWTVRINCTVLYQSLMSKGAIRNENNRARADTEGNHWAKLVMQGSENGLQVEEGQAEP